MPGKERKKGTNRLDAARGKNNRWFCWFDAVNYGAMGKIIELRGKNNRWQIASLGARMVGWEGKDGSVWRQICRGDGNKKASEDAHRGGLMFPWVNRIGGEHWSLEGTRVPVNTMRYHGNLHGRVFDDEFEIVSESAGEVVFYTMLEPGEFYPKRAECTVSYAVRNANGTESLEVCIDSKNPDTESDIAYVTTGIHPYFLNPFGGKADEMELTVAAAKEFAVDEWLIPTGLIDVKPEHDFREKRKIGPALLDNGFVLDCARTPAAALEIENFRFEIRAGENCGYLQVFIPPHREEIALEPQSGGADAFRFHQFGLRRLKPGESFRTRMELVGIFR